MLVSAGNAKPRLLFVSPRFLLPIDSGGKIRTTQILRGLKRLDHFDVTLCGPATLEQQNRYGAELNEFCSRFSAWPAPRRQGAVWGPLWQLGRLSYIVSRLPISVRSDYSGAARATIKHELATQPDIVVFDFLHSAVLAPHEVPNPKVLFTHNVEAEIFKRHLDVATNPLRRWLWQNQHRKMVEFERKSVSLFDQIVAVSERDALAFRSDYGAVHIHVIPTGVDVDYFKYSECAESSDVIFCGSMDWLANRDGVEYFLDNVWGPIADAVPEATMTVVGRAPPADLIRKASRTSNRWRFTGFVDDVRPHIQNAAVSVIPLRVGGGTRLKVFEAMAVGSAVVSTSLGVEGLGLEDGRHFRRADDAESMADSVITLLTDRDARLDQIRNARQYVTEHASYMKAAQVFQEGCIHTMSARREASNTRSR